LLGLKNAGLEPRNAGLGRKNAGLGDKNAGLEGPLSVQQCGKQALKARANSKKGCLFGQFSFLFI
jgi:hypothetical protein